MCDRSWPSSRGNWMDFEQARFNMVEQQIRTWDVLDQRVLDLLLEVRREDFVPPRVSHARVRGPRNSAGEGERMWPPKLEARVVQELELDRNDARAGSRHRQRLSDGAARAQFCRGDQRGDHRAIFSRCGSASWPRRHRQCAPGGRRLRARMGQSAVRRDRAHRFDAGPARFVAAAAEAGWPAIRRRRRSSGDDRTPDPLDGAGRIATEDLSRR